MKRSFVFTIVLLLSSILFAEDDSLYIKYPHQLQLIDSLRAFMRNTLQLEIDDHFYTKYEHELDNDSMFYMLYVSLPNRIQIPDTVGGYGAHFGSKAMVEKQEKHYREAGYHTLAYKTAGLANAMLNPMLLSYPDEAIAFILFHEANHLQHSDLPQYMDEALSDAMASYGCLRFAREKGMLNVNAVEKQSKIFEKIYRFTNKKRKIVDQMPAKKKTRMFNLWTARIKRYTHNANQFQRDRMIYTVNNAYFVRVDPYAVHYFEIKNFFREELFNYNTIVANVQKLNRPYDHKPLPYNNDSLLTPKPAPDDFGTPVVLPMLEKSAPWNW